MTVALRITAAVKRYGDVVAVDHLDLTVESGGAVALVGPNGAGKTTTMKLLTGLLAPDEGSVLLGDHWSPVDYRARALFGYVPQERGLYPALSARENLEFFARISGVSRHERRDTVDRHLEHAGLLDHADSPRVGTFSSGMAQRLHLVCGVVREPPILLLDEPTAGVDVQSRARIYEMVDDYRGQGGTVLLTTHVMEECERLCDVVHIMDHGRVVANGGLREIVKRYARASVRMSIESVTEKEIAAVVGPNVGVRRHRGWISADVPDGVQPGEIVHAIRAAGYEVGTYEVSEGTLEAAFIALTGRDLRD